MKSYFNHNLEALDKQKLIQMIEYYRRDGLTGLLGRKDFEREFHEIFINYKKENKVFYLGYADINGLHTLNRKEGYYAGDSLIRKVASCLSFNCKGEVFRSSGDEFFILSEKSNSNVCHTHEDFTFVEVSSRNYETSTQMFDDCDKLMSLEKQRYYTTTADRRKR
jgi:diguanylate cyclase (GGDEF)-like protein